jgi:hypothetical protein
MVMELTMRPGSSALLPLPPAFPATYLLSTPLYSILKEPNNSHSAGLLGFKD